MSIGLRNILDVSFLPFWFFFPVLSLSHGEHHNPGLIILIEFIYTLFDESYALSLIGGRGRGKAKKCTSCEKEAGDFPLLLHLRMARDLAKRPSRL
ncbi:hypothetical protein F4810DRAFT_676803 [Camillea tinctor]|nr:hypothetical protein F4810DRAFT_676803 [Camillea tinctor]